MHPDPMISEAFALLQSGRRGEALQRVNGLAAEGHPEALLVLGTWHLQGEVGPRDLGKARDHFRRAGEAGHPFAGIFYTNFLAAGRGGDPDWGRAMERLRGEAVKYERRRDILTLIQRMELTTAGDPAKPLPSQRLSDSPDVLLFPRLFSEAECDYLVRIAQSSFAPSVIIDDATGLERRDPVRTSDGSTIHWLIEDPAVHALNRRLAAASGTSVLQGEPLQILRYAPGQQYRKHLDAIAGRANQRIATALVYLNEDYARGETCFLATGLKVRGRKGDGIVFRNTLPNGRADPRSEHAGLPVTAGFKLLASRWICERAYEEPERR